MLLGDVSEIGRTMDNNSWTSLEKAKLWLWKHWTGLFVAYLLVFLGVYLAIWTLIEPLGIPDVITTGSFLFLLQRRWFIHVLLTILIASHTVLVLELFFRRRTWKSHRVIYQAHTQGLGWQNWVTDGTISGAVGEGRRMEALRLKLGNNFPPGVGIAYQAYIEGIGWMDWVSNGEQAGTIGLEKRLEAVRIKLTNAPTSYEIFYQSYVEGYGWMNWASNGELAGTTGESKRLEAIRILVVVP